MYVFTLVVEHVLLSEISQPPPTDAFAYTWRKGIFIAQMSDG